MNYIIFDLEATCQKDDRNFKNETIEIGAVKINSDYKLESEFCRFVKPLMNPLLSEFCKELTTIQQEDIDEALPFYTIIEEFKSWINIEEPYVLCSWGFYDKNQLIYDLSNFNLNEDWLQPHISLKHQYAQIKYLRRAIGMQGALKIEGLVMEGTHHRGIDDAKNIAKIFLNHKNHWVIG